MVFTRDAHTRTAVLARVLRTPRAGYKEYGVRRAPCLRSTDFTTRYEGFFQARGTKGTEYEKYRLFGVRILVRGTTIFSGTGYEGYGVREVPILGSTEFDTGYDDFFQARGTKGTKYKEHRTSRVRKICKNTKNHKLYLYYIDIVIPVYRLHRHCAKTLWNNVRKGQSGQLR